MKKWIIIFLVMVSFVAALTTDVDLKKFESHEFKGKNITLLNLDESDDKVIICVNNVKTIVSDRKVVNGLIVDVKSVNVGVARLELESGCSGACLCDDSCDNNLCGIIKEVQAPIEDDETNEKETDLIDTGAVVKNGLVDGKKIEEKEGGEIKNINSFTIILIDIVVILGLLVLLKRSFS